MKAYVFFNYNTEETTNSSLVNWGGTFYQKLIHSCCQYCNIVSFAYLNGNFELESNLAPFSIPLEQLPPIKGSYFARYVQKARRKYYAIDSHLKKILLQKKDLNNWFWSEDPEKNGIGPTDPTFYRSDGSVFFDSIIHEGECVILPRKTEDISFLSSVPWDYAFSPAFDLHQYVRLDDEGYPTL